MLSDNERAKGMDELHADELVELIGEIPNGLIVGDIVIMGVAIAFGFADSRICW